MSRHTDAVPASATGTHRRSSDLSAEAGLGRSSARSVLLTAESDHVTPPHVGRVEMCLAARAAYGAVRRPSPGENLGRV